MADKTALTSERGRFAYCGPGSHRTEPTRATEWNQNQHSDSDFDSKLELEFIVMHFLLGIGFDRPSGEKIRTNKYIMRVFL